MENGTDQDISLNPTNCNINGEDISDLSFDNVAIYEGQVPAHQKVISRFSMIHFGALDVESIAFDVLIQDFTQQQVLYRGNTRIELQAANGS